MLKIKKGIKKKIKGKKDKKEDLFDPEQLAKFKKELEEGKKSPLPGTDDPDHTHTASDSHTADHEQDEEWLRFKQLTSGVDDVLKKTTGDLDRIKESSFFQRTSKANEQFASDRPSSSAHRVPVPESSKTSKKASHKKAHGRKHQELSESDSEHEAPKEEPVEAPVEPEPTTKNFEPVEEETIVLDDSLFDTSFIDAVASGEIKLAYIPESPTEGPDDDDPFDTSAVADVVKKIEEDEKKRKKQVNLGTAVDFLTKKSSDSTSKVPVAVDPRKKPRPRPHNVNLIGSFDDDTPLSVLAAADTTVERAKDLFDEILDSPTKDTLLDEISIEVQLKTAADSSQRKESLKDDKSNLKDLISEFEIFSDATVDDGVLSLKLGPEPEEYDEDDEFAQLAAESIHKVVVATPSKVAPPKPPPPASAAHQQEEAEEGPVEDEEEDPFDTTFVEKLQPGKEELKILESEFLTTDGNKTGAGEDDDDDDYFDFNPRLGEPEPTTASATQISPAAPTDLFETFEEDQSTARDKAIQPVSELVLFDSVQDPFDTSNVDTVLPGKTELKLLEEELLNIVDSQPSEPVFSAVATAIINTPAVPADTFEGDDFDDFDPRAGEEKPEPVHPLDTHEEQVSATVLVPVTDLEVEFDPFDTSIVTDSILPGKIELRLLESELNSVLPAVCAPFAQTQSSEPLVSPQPSELERKLSDPDFNPRDDEEPQILIVTDNIQRDVFESHENLTCEKPLTPLQGDAKKFTPQSDFIDPFDTSAVIVDDDQVSKADLKLLEGELLNSTVDVAPARALPQFIVTERPSHPPPRPAEPPTPHLFETEHPIEEGGELVKPLIPCEIDELGRPSVFEDSFDTSIVATTKVAPGKTELKILEEELDVEPGLTRSYTDYDPDFNPRETVHPSAELSCQPLTPQVQGTSNPSAGAEEEQDDFDPFDTTHAEALIPGKAELKILEAELL